MNVSIGIIIVIANADAIADVFDLFEKRNSKICKQ